MSAPDPEKWRATDEEVGKIADLDLNFGDSSEEPRKVIERIARRRALEELRALSDEMASAYYGGKHPDDPGLLAARKIIHDRIAEIKAEEA